ncbi:MAG: hypothetical protein PHC99_10135 [Methylococcales bacterium]|nr:hypothetical protein [Methylococcales bacterium]
MTDEIEVKPKNKGGRPKGTTKEKGGKNLWIPSEILDTVLLMIQATRQRQQQAKS